MIDAEDRLMLKVLEMEGMSISAIARETEHDRKTVQKYLTSGMQMSQIKKRRGIPVTLCEPFSENIIGHIRNGLSSEEIYRDLVTNHDFLGSYESIKLYVRQQRQTLQLSRQAEYFASLWILKLLQGGFNILSMSPNLRKTWMQKTSARLSTVLLINRLGIETGLLQSYRTLKVFRKVPLLGHYFLIQKQSRITSEDLKKEVLRIYWI